MAPGTREMPPAATMTAPSTTAEMPVGTCKARFGGIYDPRNSWVEDCFHSADSSTAAAAAAEEEEDIQRRTTNAFTLEQTSALFDAWMQHLADFESLDVTIKLYHMWYQDEAKLYVAIEIDSFRTTSHILRVPNCHLTVGTYAIKPKPDSKKLDTPDKARGKAKKLLSDAKERVDYFNRWGAHVRLLYTSFGRRDDFPKVFQLCLCTNGFALDRLAVGIEQTFSGNFAVTHSLGIRTMLYLAGPHLHVSVYSGVQIEEVGGVHTSVGQL